MSSYIASVVDWDREIDFFVVISKMTFEHFKCLHSILNNETVYCIYLRLATVLWLEEWNLSRDRIISFSTSSILSSTPHLCYQGHRNDRCLPLVTLFLYLIAVPFFKFVLTLFKTFSRSHFATWFFTLTELLELFTIYGPFPGGPSVIWLPSWTSSRKLPDFLIIHPQWWYWHKMARVFLGG